MIPSAKAVAIICFCVDNSGPSGAQTLRSVLHGSAQSSSQWRVFNDAAPGCCPLRQDQVRVR